MISEAAVQRVVSSFGEAFNRLSVKATSLRGLRSPAIIASITRRPLRPMMSLITESI